MRVTLGQIYIKKKTLRKRKYKLKKNTDKFLKAKYSNAKLYWKFLKDVLKVSQSNNLSALDFVRYFKSINNPDNNFYQADEDILYFNERFLNSETLVVLSELDNEISNCELLNSVIQLKTIQKGVQTLF